jgi:hypothetical protein
MFQWEAGNSSADTDDFIIHDMVQDDEEAMVGECEYYD